MHISIIIPAYNAERFIGESIQSVFNQTTADWELIVVDDASTDRTATIVREFSDPRVRLLCLPQNGGPAAARQAGTIASRHDLLCYLDADDRLCQNALEVLGGALSTHPDAIVAYAGYVRVDAAGRRYGLRKTFQKVSKPSGNVLQATLRGSLMPNGGCALVRREAVIESACWQNHLRCAEDWAAWALLATKGPFIYVPNFIALEYRELPSGLSQTHGIVFENFRPALDAVFNNPAIKRQFSHDKLRHLRARQESHFFTYTAMLNIRKGSWRKAVMGWQKALKISPYTGFVNTARILFAIVDKIL